MKKTIAFSVVIFLLIAVMVIFIGWQARYRYYKVGEGTGTGFLRLNTITGEITFTYINQNKWIPWTEK